MFVTVPLLSNIVLIKELHNNKSFCDYTAIAENDMIQKCFVLCLPNRLITLFLTVSQRTLYVQLKGFKSSKYYATSGAGQGSNLGPLLSVTL